MSEVNDAVQVVMVMGKVGYVLGNISTKSALFILKIINTIYHAKWKGKAGLRRFRQIKGDDFTFINVGTEDRRTLKAIEKEMKAHGILYARLPDLCGGDGRTQYVISLEDAGKFKAFLLDHAAGKHNDIKVGPISPEDYAKTGIGSDGRETSELKDLTKSAATKGKKDTAWRTTTELAEVKIHDAKAVFGQNISFLEKTPLKQHEKWVMYQMPDGVHAIIVPRENIINNRMAPDGAAKPDLAIIYHNKNYIVVNMFDGQQAVMEGHKVGREIGMPDVMERYQQAKNMSQNLGIAKEERNQRDVAVQETGLNKEDISLYLNRMDELDEVQKEYTRVTINKKMFRKSSSPDYYVTRIPFRKDSYVKIPTEDAYMYDNNETLAAYIHSEKNYEIIGEDGTLRDTVSGKELSACYDNKSREKNIPNGEKNKETNKYYKKPVAKKAGKARG